MARLIAPEETIDLLDRVCYWLVKPNGTRENPSDSAMLTFFKRGDRFTLGYWPMDDGSRMAAPHQVVEDLPLDQLPDAVASLAAAGFGQAPPVPRPSTLPALSDGAVVDVTVVSRQPLALESGSPPV